MKGTHIAAIYMRILPARILSGTYMCRIMRLILLRIEKFEELCQYERSSYLHPDVLQKAKQKFREHANQPTSSW